MIPIETAVTCNNGNSAVIHVTPQNPCQIGLGIEYTSGSVTVQFCFDDSLSTWYDHPELTNLAANAAGNIDKPIRALRIHSTVGVATLRALQFN